MRSMRIPAIIDPPQLLRPASDSTVAILDEAHLRGPRHLDHADRRLRPACHPGTAARGRSCHKPHHHTGAQRQ